MVYRSLLVPLDGSPFAEQALPVAIEIAQAAQASIRLVLVHQPSSPDTKARLAALKAERSYLQHVAARAKEITGTRLTAVTLNPPVVPALREHIDRTGVDLVVMTTHGRGMLERAWLGSVADALLRTADVPILLIRPAEKAPAGARLEVTRLLVPLDGSPLSEQIIQPAMAMARLLGAEVSLVQLVTPVDLPSDLPAFHALIAPGYDVEQAVMGTDKPVVPYPEHYRFIPAAADAGIDHAEKNRTLGKTPAIGRQ